VEDLNSSFCISGAVMGFPKILLSQKDLNMKETRELKQKSLLPFLLQNVKCRRKKQKEIRKLNRKN